MAVPVNPLHVTDTLAEEPKPDKKSLLEYLTTARSVIESITAVSGLIPWHTSALS
jgi:hypothetical protein